MSDENSEIGGTLTPGSERPVPSNASSNTNSNSITESDLIERVGPYRIRREIGRGAMGTVYEAEHSNLSRIVALKVLPKDLAESADRINRFRREMSAIGRLDHPNIVLATDAGEADGYCYIAMQFIQGRDLESLLEQASTVPIAESFEIVRQAAQGLQHIEQHHLVHRDIKPANLIITHEGQVKILDLGIAMLRQIENQRTAMTAAGALMGTPDFIAPEQITECQAVDIRADIYSLGCTLYNLLGGQAPFSGPGYTTFTSKLIGHAERDPVPLAKLNNSLPTEVHAIVEKMMAKDPDKRYRTPAQVAEAVSKLASNANLQVWMKNLSNGQPRDIKKGASLQNKNKKAALKFSKYPALITVTLLLLAGLVAATIWKFDATPTTVDVKTTASLNPEPASKNVAVENVASQDASSQNSLSPDTSALKTPTSNTSPPIESPPSVAVVAEANPSQEPSVPLEEAASKSEMQTLSKSVNSIDQSAKSIAESNATIAATTREIALTLEEMRTAFEKSQKSDTPIAMPTTANDHYANAKWYLQKGDNRNAWQSFMKYFENELDMIDPVMEFTRLLKLQEGSAGARETFTTLPGNTSSLARKFGALLLLEPERRRSSLKDFIADEPGFAPAYYEMSRVMSAANDNNRSLTDRYNEKVYLETFLDLHGKGKLLRYFLDQSKASEMIDTVKSRLEKLSSISAATIANPVTINMAIPVNDFWKIGFAIAEPALEISYKTNKDEPFKSLGTLGSIAGGVESIDPRTGKPYPNNQLEIAKDNKPTEIIVQYVDVDNIARGPFLVTFDQEATLRKVQRSQLESSKRQWLRIQDEKMYFDLFHSGAPVLKEVRYGLDVEQPDTPRPIPKAPFSEANFQEFVLNVSPTLQFATIQVTYLDGTTSEVIKIPRRK